MNILLTGGLGFIGSHTATQLANANTIIIIDNCSNSSHTVLNMLRSILPNVTIAWYKKSLDCDDIEYIFQIYNIDTIMHFAGLKSVAESIHAPLKYYEVNIMSVINLLKLCEKYHVKRFICSSLTQDNHTGIINPYERTQSIIEHVLKDSFRNMSIIIVRHFDPVGTHPSALFEPRTINKKEPSRCHDINIMDLAKEYVKALNYCIQHPEPIFEIFNIETLQQIKQEQNL
jgi:UDP-glucose 4-epimerase